MSDKYQLIDQFVSYATKPDPSNTDQRYLVKGSRNTIINDGEKIETRKGYTRKGAAGSGIEPIKSSADWQTSTGIEHSLRAFGDRLELWMESQSAWILLADGFTDVRMVFDAWWDNTEKIDELVFVNRTSSIFRWSGGAATLANANNIGGNKIVINEDIGESRFYTTGTLTFKILDDGGVWREFTYSAIDGSTFTLTEDPTQYTYPENAPILQIIREETNTPTAEYSNDFIKVIDNQLLLGSYTSRLFYVSQNDDITNYSFSSPRITGEGALLTLDASGRGIAALAENPVLFAGEDYVYKVVFTEIDVSGTLAETIAVKRMKTTSGQGAINHDLIADIGNAIAYVGNDKVLRIIEQPEEVEVPLLRDASDIIKTDFDALDFTNGHLKFHKTRLYIAVPASSTNYILEFKNQGGGRIKRFWQPPQTFPVRRYAVIGGEIHGHSSGFNESYKLFDGVSDNGNAINAIAKLAKLHNGKRSQLKYADEIYNEGYVRGNTEIEVTYTFEEDGGEISTVSETISGLNETTSYEQFEDPSLGVNALGVYGLTGDAEADDDLPPKYREIHEISPRYYFDMAVQYETNDVDQAWQILAYGPNALIDGEMATAIKK